MGGRRYTTYVDGAEISDFPVVNPKNFLYIETEDPNAMVLYRQQRVIKPIRANTIGHRPGEFSITHFPHMLSYNKVVFDDVRLAWYNDI